MELPLDDTTRHILQSLRRKERQTRHFVKISVILALDAGYSIPLVAEMYALDASSVYRYKESFLVAQTLESYLEFSYKGYAGRLTEQQLALLKQEVSTNLYLTTKEVCKFVKDSFGVVYHPHHMAKLLCKQGFVYKKTKSVPGKADLAQQQAYLERFKTLMEEKPADTKVFFNDGVHPMYNTKPEYGWIAKGADYQMPTQTGRQRLNITGAVNAECPTELYGLAQERVNAQSTIALWQRIEAANPSGKIIHICDNARYYRCKLITDWLNKKHRRTSILYLPTYAPNLNPIERVWKLLRKEKISSYWYNSYKEFKEAVMDFFEQPHRWKKQLDSLVTLNFRAMGY